MRDSVVFYRSFYEAIKNLPAEEFKRAACAILDYALDGLEPESRGIEWAIYTLAKPQIDANNRRYENGKKGGRQANQDVTKEEPNTNQSVTKAQPNVNVNVNVNDKKENTLKGVKEKHFVPPTLENVREYCQEKGYNVDAERFVDFYESKGWMIGKNKMKDWKATVRNWARGQNKPAGSGPIKPKKNAFQNFNQREYDFAELERQLIKR